MNTSPQESLKQEDSNDSYSEMDQFCNAVVSTAMSPHWSSPPEPEISGEAVAFALVGTQLRRWNRETRETALHAIGSNATSEQVNQIRKFALESTNRSVQDSQEPELHEHRHYVVRERSKDFAADLLRDFERTRSDPSAKRTRDLAQACVPENWGARSLAGSTVDSGWKRVCVQRSNSSSLIDDVDLAASYDQTQFGTRPSSFHEPRSFHDVESRVLRCSSASAAVRCLQALTKVFLSHIRRLPVAC